MKFFLKLFLVAFCMLISVIENPARAQNEIKRSSEAVIMTGEQIEAMIGVPPNDIVGFRRQGGTWTQIPVQVDERDSVDGETIYGHTPVEEFLNENWGSDLDMLKILTYTDTATFTGADKDPLFDHNDELLFMARDAGVRYLGVELPQNVEAGSPVEIRLVDPLTQEEGYIYLFVQDGSLDPSAGIKYVDYRFNLLSGNYKETYTIGGLFDPEDSYVTTKYYQTHFSDRWIKDRLIIPANGATAYDTINILDRHKTLLEPNNCGRTEVVFSSQEGAFVTNKSGPIRAIRSYFGANSGPLNQREHHFYEQSEEVTFFLRMHSIRGIVDIMDHSRSAIGMKYKNNNNADWITFDGVAESINTGRIIWEILTGDQGSWTSFSSISHNFNITDVLQTYYEDNLAPIDTQCTGDSVAIGSVGHLIPIRIPLTDPRGLTTNRLSLKRVNYYQEPNLDENHVFQLEAERSNPISACAGNCDLVPVSPTNLIVTDTLANAITIIWTDNSLIETGFVIERSEEESTTFVEAGRVNANIETFTDTGLLQSTDYRYRVKAINEEYSSSYSNIVELKTARDVNSGPTELQMTGRTASSISLSWEDNTSSETGFSIEKTGPGDNKQFFEVAVVAANATRYTDTDLLPDMQYSYRIRALVEPISTTFSNILHAKTAGAAPDAPSELNYQVRAPFLISLVWVDNSNNEEGFIIERTTGESNVVTFQDTVGAGVTAYTDVGLESNTIYRYKVTAFNEGGSNSSDILATKTAGEVPLAPSNLSAGAYSKTNVRLEWTDNSLEEIGFIIERSTAEDVETMIVIDSVDKDIAFYEDIVDLNLHNYYMYRIKAYNQDGVSAPSNNARTSSLTTVEDESSESFSLYPNPGDGEFSINVSGATKGVILIKVLDPSGRILSENESIIGSNEFLSMDLSYLALGSYFVVIEGRDFKIVKRFLKIL